MATMDEVKFLAKKYSQAWTTLADLASAVNAEIEEVRARHHKTIQDCVKRHEIAYTDLKSAIESDPQNFADPKTVEMHGIKFGLTKQGDKLDYDEKTTISLIKRNMAEKAEFLLKSTEKIVLTALKKLDAKSLGKIGCELIPGADEAFVKPVASGDIEKLVEKISLLA